MLRAGRRIVFKYAFRRLPYPYHPPSRLRDVVQRQLLCICIQSSTSSTLARPPLLCSVVGADRSMRAWNERLNERSFYLVALAKSY
ncbi:unnamed protein product [Soboliphyme baturini]|uniref:Uncharacterized protein n=1 Tax=Soboliphyme baturini TaxID=241478 RepID=A0A183IMR0_9BILA|nr:unnamed protein product [Soboliphyme baturini]